MIDSVYISGGVLPVPELTCSSLDLLSCSLLVSEYNIELSTYHCGIGIPLIEVSAEEVKPSRLVVGSPPVTGMFSLSLQGVYIHNIPADISAENLKKEMENAFPEEGGFEVTRFGNCYGYKWQVTWLNQGGDQLPMKASSTKLRGDSPDIEVETSTNGGTWLNQIRGDMIRQPETQPQVILSHD